MKVTEKEYSGAGGKWLEVKASEKLDIRKELEKDACITFFSV